MTPAEQKQAIQQEQAAANVVHCAVKVKEHGPIPILVRDLRNATVKLRKQHYGVLPHDGETYWERLDDEFQILGDFAGTQPLSRSEPLDDFLNYLKFLFSTRGKNDQGPDQATQPTRDAIDRREDFSSKDALERMEEGQGTYPPNSQGIGSLPGAVQPVEHLEDNAPFHGYSE